MMAQADEIQFLKNRIKVLELELEELRAYKSRHIQYARNHYNKRKLLAQEASRYLSNDEIKYFTNRGSGS
jgi:DNA polymerase III delta prime subunit